jgi:hypothetical protein
MSSSNNFNFNRTNNSRPSSLSTLSNLDSKKARENSLKREEAPIDRSISRNLFGSPSTLSLENLKEERDFLRNRERTLESEKEAIDRSISRLSTTPSIASLRKLEEERDFLTSRERNLESEKEAIDRSISRKLSTTPTTPSIASLRKLEKERDSLRSREKELGSKKESIDRSFNRKLSTTPSIASLRKLDEERDFLTSKERTFESEEEAIDRSFNRKLSTTPTTPSIASLRKLEKERESLTSRERSLESRKEPIDRSINRKLFGNPSISSLRKLEEEKEFLMKEEKKLKSEELDIDRSIKRIQSKSRGMFDDIDNTPRTPNTPKTPVKSFSRSMSMKTPMKPSVRDFESSSSSSSSSEEEEDLGWYGKSVKRSREHMEIPHVKDDYMRKIRQILEKSGVVFDRIFYDGKEIYLNSYSKVGTNFIIKVSDVEHFTFKGDDVQMMKKHHGQELILSKSILEEECKKVGTCGLFAKNGNHIVVGHSSPEFHKVEFSVDSDSKSFQKDGLSVSLPIFDLRDFEIDGEELQELISRIENSAHACVDFAFNSVITKANDVLQKVNEASEKFLSFIEMTNQKGGKYANEIDQINDAVNNLMLYDDSYESSEDFKKLSVTRKEKNDEIRKVIKDTNHFINLMTKFFYVTNLVNVIDRKLVDKKM